MLAHNCPAPLRRRLTADTFAPITRIPLSYCFCGNLHAPSLVLIRKDEYPRRKDEYSRPISHAGRTGHHGRIILDALNAFGHLPRLAGRVVEFGAASNAHAPEPVMNIQQKALLLPIRRGDGRAAIPDPGRRTCLAPMAAERVRRVGVLIYGGGESQSSQAQAASLREGLKESGLDGRRNLRIELAFESDPETIRARAEVLVAPTPDSFPYRLEAG